MQHLTIRLHDDNVLQARFALRDLVPKPTKLSHLTEALAAGLGFKTYAGLLEGIREHPSLDCGLDVTSMFLRLSELGGNFGPTVAMNTPAALLAANVARIVDIRSLQATGLSSTQVRHLRKVLCNPRPGLYLVGGPIGSGKSTILEAIQSETGATRLSTVSESYAVRLAADGLRRMARLVGPPEVTEAHLPGAQSEDLASQTAIKGSILSALPLPLDGPGRYATIMDSLGEPKLDRLEQAGEGTFDGLIFGELRHKDHADQAIATSRHAAVWGDIFGRAAFGGVLTLRKMGASAESVLAPGNIGLLVGTRLLKARPCPHCATPLVSSPMASAAIQWIEAQVPGADSARFVTTGPGCKHCTNGRVHGPVGNHTAVTEVFTPTAKELQAAWEGNISWAIASARERGEPPIATRAAQMASVGMLDAFEAHGFASPFPPAA